MTNYYSRSGIVSFSELTDEQQKEVVDLYGQEISEETQYVLITNKQKKAEALPLSMFMQTTGNNFTHGIYGLSGFDGYFVTLSRSGDEAVVAHKYF